MNLNELLKLKKSLQAHKNTLLNDMENEGYNHEKHDINIVVGNKNHVLSMHADLYSELMFLVESQIKKEKE